ncbi:helix-turn-helix domain-containing protein [Spirillospora sp. NPDC048911]|uniref:helix-turn-helix domain-containing protein n=1 Tax=Spirillospora sp. NPDC048911 TaxID=3364527 RepID=UPI00371A7270
MEVMFRTPAEVLNLGTVVVSSMAGPSIEADRAKRLIRRCDPEVVLLHLSCGGSGRASQGRYDNSFGAGDFVLCDSGRPPRMRHVAATEVSRLILVKIPRAPLQALVPSISGLLAVPFNGRQGMGAVLSRYLDELVRNAHAYRPSEAASLGRVTLDLIATTCAHQLADDARPLVAHQEELLAGIREFIERHLADPALTPGAIAAAHHISTRHLHKLFQAKGELSVAAWIRHHRLERCRRDLADPRLAELSVCAIASRWGFTDAAHFGRLFRKVMGRCPTDYRKLHLDAE